MKRTFRKVGKLGQKPAGKKWNKAKRQIKEQKNGQQVLIEKRKKELGLDEKRIEGIYELLIKIPREEIGNYNLHPVNYAATISVLHKLLGGFNRRKLLELGYREEGILKYLQKQGAQLSGLDRISPLQIPGINLVQGEIKELDKHFIGKKFDVIFSRETINPPNFKRAESQLTLVATEELFKKIKSKLNNGGWLVLTSSYPTETSGIAFRDLALRTGFEIINYQTNENELVFIARKK